MERIKDELVLGHAARWWSILPVTDADGTGGKILCELCPRYCRIGEGQRGFCYVRFNENGELRTGAYGCSTGFALDPIEKKPLFHVYPGKKIFSFGTAGCNMGCKFCQNWDISKAKVVERMSGKYSAREIIDRAVELEMNGNVGLAFTYNDPTIWAEWAYDLAVTAKESGLISVMVTNGYMTQKAIKEVYPVIDAANVDLKGFTDEFYFKLTYSHLKPVLEGIKWIKNGGTWIELTTLLIPGYNDNEDDLKNLCLWVNENCGEDTPLHFTAFHPDYKMMDVRQTPFGTLKKAYNIGYETGLRYVYTGNVFDEKTGSTYCSSCNELLIRRNLYYVDIVGLEGNKCGKCGEEVKGIF